MRPDPGEAAWERRAGGVKIVRLKRRAEFLRVAKGRRWHGAAMTLQGALRPADDEGGEACRFGFTLTKKVGNAVVRNRARRRLREVVRLAADDLPIKHGYDYVVVGRLDALRLPFAELTRELARGLGAVHQAAKSRSDKREGARDRVPREAQSAERTATETARQRS